MNTSFWKAGHAPTLFAAFLYFDLSFMIWYVLGPMGVQIAADLQLTTQQRGMMVATPILAGAVLRFLMGILADRTSPKTAGLIGQVIVIGALFCAWQLGIHSYEQALLLGLFLGFAGASFAVSLPLASQWYPPEHQGKAMGIALRGRARTERYRTWARAAGNALMAAKPGRIEGHYDLTITIGETARLDPDDIASFALLRIGDHDARQIVDALDTLQAVRLYVALPTATLDTLRLLLQQPTTETLEIVRRDQTLEP